MVCFLGTASIFLPPLMVERNVLVSNLMGFLATRMIGPLGGFRNAQKATSYDRRVNECVRGRERQCRGRNCRARQTNGFTVGVESQTSALGSWWSSHQHYVV